MTTSKNHKYTQLKWLYSALSGLCAAYFLALFSGTSSLDDSVLLQLSTIFFAICLPIFSTFAFTHVYMFELDAPVENCDKALNEPWVVHITIKSFVCLLLAFLFLIGHFSINAMIAFFFVSVSCAYCLADFLKKLDNNDVDNN